MSFLIRGHFYLSKAAEHNWIFWPGMEQLYTIISCRAIPQDEKSFELTSCHFILHSRPKIPPKWLIMMNAEREYDGMSFLLSNLSLRKYFQRKLHILEKVEKYACSRPYWGNEDIFEIPSGLKGEVRRKNFIGSKFLLDPN